MNALTWLLLLAPAALTARALQLRHRQSAWECLWRLRSGPVTVELRRHAELARFASDSLEFPQPREFRILVTSAGGVPLWSQQAIVSLPGDVDSRIGSIAASEFDHLFPVRFSQGWTRRPLRLAARAH